MRGRGWHFHLQKGLKEFNIPPNIHLTLSPVHDDVAEEFLQDASKAVNERASVNLDGLIEMVQKGSFTEILRDFEEGKIDSSIVPILLDSLPEEVASEIVKEIVIGWYR
jgi:hypothetical protein